MASIRDIPELKALDRQHQMVRIPQEIDVPLTGRIRNLIDTPEFRRLAHIRQLGLVSLVYPAAHHTRFEHSLGVYRLALLYLKQLAGDERFAESVSPADAERFIVAALLHDLGHWPFCHPIEDMQLPGVPQHELFANSFLLEGEIADLLNDEWGLAPRELVSLLSDKPHDSRGRLLASMLSGPIDVDKMDYLMRDSLHAGVPYGRNFDQQRLIGSLCVNEEGDGLAITAKGRTAAEMMVFARYVMFSEVYWHHAVRCATAMLQRAFYLVYQELDLDFLFRQDEQAMISAVRSIAGKGPAGELLDGLFGPVRRLYKRFAQFSAIEDAESYGMLARRPYSWLVVCAENLAEVFSRESGVKIDPHHVLLDAPPVQLEVQFNVEIGYERSGLYRKLGDVSPVVRTLAREQFEDYVKRVRVFVHPALKTPLSPLADRTELIAEAVEMTC